jgi:bifunctional DNase/RNase
MFRQNRLLIPAACLILLFSRWEAGATPQTPAPPASPEARPVPVHVSGIKVIGPDQVLLLLADDKEERAVPISVGRDQGLAIYLGRTRTGTPRPMTHDLLANVLAVLGADIEKITITEMRDNVYYAEINLKSGDQVHVIDARPSDAIALALRTHAPMFAAPALLHRFAAAEEPDATIHADRGLGLTVQELDPDLAESLGAAGVAGVLVSSVLVGGPAGRAGVVRGDIVRSIDGRPVPNLAAYREATGPGVKSLTVWRDGKETVLRTP